LEEVQAAYDRYDLAIKDRIKLKLGDKFIETSV
jgi:hypothetical protein